MNNGSKFRYKFEKGNKIFYAVNILGEIVVSTPMGKMKNPVEIFMRISQKIKNIKNDLASIEVIIESAIPGKNMGTVPMPETGKISMMEMNSRGLVKMLSGDYGWQGAEYSQMQFPEQSISIGSDWEQITEPAAGSGMPLKTRYVFEEFDDESGIAIFASELFTTPTPFSGAEKLGEGWFRFDSKNGWIHSCLNKITHSYTMPLPEDPNIKIQTDTLLEIKMNRE
jgi:hypothetical protein